MGDEVKVAARGSPAALALAAKPASGQGQGDRTVWEVDPRT